MEISTINDELYKLRKWFVSKESEVHLRLTDNNFCDSGHKHYTFGRYRIGVCEKCTKDVLDSVEPLIIASGGNIVLARYSLIAEIRIIERRLVNVKAWSPEYFEDLKDLCTRNLKEQAMFDDLFKPNYRRARHELKD